MKAKEFIIVEAKVAQKSKPRNPVAKNSGVTASGAGQHKDRKAAAKRGEVKHKGKQIGESQVYEVSKDFAERNRASQQIAKILDSSKGTQWDDYTPEQLKQIQQLAKITGRTFDVSSSVKLGSIMKVGRIVDLMSKYVGMKQRDSGEMPEFTGRAATAKDMANQIALQTNGDAIWRHNTTWTDGRTGRRHRDPQDHVAYKDKQSYDDAWQWIESKGKKVHYKNNFNDLKTAIQIGSYIVEPSTRTRAAFSDKPTTEYSVSVRSVKAIGQPTRTKQDITDQQAAAIRDIANTRGENAMKMIQALIDVLDGEKDVKQVIDQSKKINPADKAKLDKIIAGAGNFKESKSHISPSGVETNMDPEDDDYAINYGKNGNVAKFRKKQGVDVKTGNKKAANESVAVNPPKFPDDWSEEKKRAAWQKWLRSQTKKSADAQTDVQNLANQLRKRQQGIGEGDNSEMDSPEFQQALASVKKKSAQGPKKTVYDPRTGKYKVVPVNPQGK